MPTPNDDGTVSSEEVAAEPRAAISRSPGQYRTSYEVLEFTCPGARSREAADAGADGRAGLRKAITFCLTPEQAARTARADGQEHGRGQLHDRRFDVSGGTISPRCSARRAGGTQHVKMDGR
jgi:hypothetical protein